MRHSGMRAAAVSLAVAMAISLCACERKDEQIKVYRVAKAPLENPPMPEAPMPTNASSPSALSTAAPAAIVPPNWEAQPLSQMRQASFVVHGENAAVADISFVVLGPAAGN